MDVGTYRKLMEKTLKHLEEEFSRLQLGRASTGLVENIDVYIPEWDMKQKLNQIANINIVDGQTIKIEPWDKGTVNKIEKGIYDSGLGFTPINQGDGILIKIPPLTKERRMDLTKIVSREGEETKVAIRNIRHDGLKEVKAQFDQKLISEDQKKAFEKQMDDLAKEFSTKVDNEVKNKSEEIMKIQ